jgi:quercetin dioxygenase-like cupin family protein
LYQEI